uniref:Uncharacterized protein n=1 Tax=Meloidogyne hapla TaxID=6305 RepID=A0A1I8C136_MELHA
MSQGGGIKRGLSEPRGGYQYGDGQKRIPKRPSTNCEDVNLVCTNDENATVNINLNDRHFFFIQCKEDEHGNLEVSVNSKAVKLSVNGQEFFLEQEWKRRIDTTNQKIYNPEKFIEEAEGYLKEDPPNIIQAGEKCWGAMGAAIALFYKDLEINLQTDINDCYDGLFLGESAPESARLGGAIECAKRGHRNFYRGFMSYNTMEKNIKKVKKFIAKLNEIDKKKVENDLTPHVLAGKIGKIFFNQLKTSDYLCGIKYDFQIEVDDKKK